VGNGERSRTRESFDAIADEFAATRRRPWPAVLRFLEGLPPETVVLDLGCGNGRHLRAVTESGRRGIGLDASRQLLTHARDAAPIVCGDLTQLPFLGQTADACLLIACLHHLTATDRHATLREARRVLRHGGVAFAMVWALDQPRFAHLHHIDGRGVDTQVPWGCGPGAVDRFYHLYVDGELAAEFTRAGFAVQTYFREEDNYAVLGRRHG